MKHYLSKGSGPAVLALLGGILLTTSLAPLSWWPLAIVGLALLLTVLHDKTPKPAFFLGWAFGTGLFGSGASWVYVSILDYGNAPFILALFLTVLWSVGLGLLLGATCALLRWINQHSRVADLLLFPALWVLGEWVRTWLLTGFPWLFIGYGQVSGPLQAWVPIVGVFGIGLLLAFSAACISCFALANNKVNNKIRVICISLLCLIWSYGLLGSPLRWSDDTGKRISVSMVQANIDQNEKWTASKIPQHLALHERLTEPVWSSDLIVWPEAAISKLLHRAQPILERLHQRAVEEEAVFISGIPFLDFPEPDEKYKVYNAIVSVGLGFDSNSGFEPGLYLKQKLVPFGEFMPLENKLRGLIDFFDLPMSSFSAGPKDQSFLQLGPYSIAPLICYEADYPDLIIGHQQGVPDLLLTISNDTWFGKSFGPLQHLEMAQMRALEFGRSMIRSTNNGISALISPSGKITAQTAQFEQQVLTGSVVIQTGITPFARFGSTPTLLFCLLLLVFGIWLGRKSNSAGGINN